MPRRARLLLPEFPAHLVHRGNNRTPCFAESADCQLYLALLAQAAARHRCRIHGYVLMTNHVHLLASASEASGFSAMMKRTAETYAMAFNRRHARTGTLWEGRFHSSVVQSERYLLECYRYIEMNPVRAGMVPGPQDYRWSSFEANAFGGMSFVEPHELYFSLGASQEERQAAYRAMFGSPQDESTLAMIRRAIQGGFVVGDSAFAAGLEAVAGRPATMRPRGRRPRQAADDEGKLSEMWSVP